MLKKNVLPRRMPAYASVCQRMRPCLKRIQPMPNIPLAYVSVFQRMSDIFHTRAYASTIRNSVTGPLGLINVLDLYSKISIYKTSSTCS
jgi:hypothetical protein